MGKSHETHNKKEKEKKKVQKRKEKEERKLDRKQNSDKGKSLEEMFAYVDENGNITSTPPDPKKRKEINVENILLGAQKHVEPDADEFRTGFVSFFNDAKGFGFIKDELTKEDIFVHINSVDGLIKENNKVKFKVVRGDRGLNAVEVSVVK